MSTQLSCLLIAAKKTGVILLGAGRGYLGPLGDDFPAIFPIAMGLLLFFSAITLTYDYYSEKRDAALLMEANTALAKAVQTQLVFDVEYWDEMCVLVDKTKVNYGVRAKMELVKFSGGSSESITRIPRSGGTRLDDNPCVDFEDENGDDLPYLNDFFISLSYPVLIESTTGSEVATLVVTTWI